MSTQIPKEVYAYVVSYIGTLGQVIPTVPPLTANLTPVTGNAGNYLIKIKDDSPSTSIVHMSLGSIAALVPTNMLATKIVTTADVTNNYVYVGGADATNGGIYRVINDNATNTVPFILKANTNGIFDVDESNKKLYYANSAGTSTIIKDLSVAPLPDIIITTIYTSITEIKVSPDGKKLLIAGTALVGLVNAPIIDIYVKDNASALQLANRVTYVPNASLPTNVVTEITINKTSTLAYAVNPLGTMVSSIQLIGSYSKTDKLLIGYVPNSVQLKGTELYIADSSAARILKLNAIDLSVLLIIVPPYSPSIIPNKLALTAYEDALYVSPFASTDIVSGINQWRVDVIDPITGIDTRKSTYNVGLYSETGTEIETWPSPIATFTVLSDNDISPTVPLPDDRLQDLNEAVCIITTKVFSSCKEKDCLADIPTDQLTGLPPYVLTNISFGNAVISNEVVTFLDDGTNLSRVEFDVNAPYTINYTAAGVPHTVTGNLNLGHKDILMYIPQTANYNASAYRFVVETYTEILDGPNVVNNTFVFTVGIYEIFKVVEDVQLFIPAFGYCPVPTDCTPFIPTPPSSICDTFLGETTFPEDFFPFQYEYFKH